MHLLILDFLARRWWVLLGIAAFAAMGGAVGALYIFTLWAFVALMVDGQRGWFRTVAGLPLSRRSQASAWWFISVVPATLAAALGLFIGVVIFQMTHGPQMIPLPNAPVYTLVLNPNYFAPWFELAVGAWVGLGYAAFYFLIEPLETGRPPSTAWQKIVAFFKMMLMISALFGPMSLSFVLPKNPGMMVAWHWALFALVPVLVVVSWYAAPAMVARRLRGIRGMATGAAAAPAPEPVGGLTGMRLLLARILMLVGFCVACTALPAVGIAWAFKGIDQDGLRLLVPFIVFTSFCKCGLANAGNDLCVLRSLPLSTTRLAAIRMIAPLTTGLCLALVLTVLSRPETDGFPPPLKFLTFSLSISGGYALIISCRGQFTLLKYSAVVLFGAALIVAGFLDFQKATPMILPAGAVALLISFPLSKRGLRRSEVYREQRRTIKAAYLPNR